jgi:hypothetical protein
MTGHRRTGASTLRFAGPIHEACFPPYRSAHAIGRRRHISAGAGHDGSRRGVVREAAPAATAAYWACERPDAQADRNHRKNEGNPCDHAVPATYDMAAASTWSQSNLSRLDIAQTVACASVRKCPLRPRASVTSPSGGGCMGTRFRADCDHDERCAAGHARPGAG